MIKIADPLLSQKKLGNKTTSHPREIPCLSRDLFLFTPAAKQRKSTSTSKKQKIIQKRRNIEIHVEINKQESKMMVI